MEALATSRAVSFAKELSIHQMVVEGDSLQVIQAINEARPGRTMYGHVINDIRFLSSSISCSFLHVKRKCNRLAHSLARRLRLVGVKIGGTEKEERKIGEKMIFFPCLVQERKQKG